MRARSRRPASLLVSVAALVMLLGACSSDATSPPSTRPTATDTKHRVAVAEDALAAPGTEVVPGVEVQPGSQRVGPTFPLHQVSTRRSTDGSTRSFTREVIGWQAVFVVDGEPTEVWDRYVRELDLGEDALAVRRCWLVPIVLPESSVQVSSGAVPPSTTSSDERAEQIRCSASGMEMRVGVGDCLQFDQQEPELCTGRSVAHLYIRQGTGPMDDAFPPPDSGVPEGFRLDTEISSRLPGPGGRYDDGLDYFLNDAASLEMAPGTRSLVAPAVLLECNSGLVAVLDLPGDPDEAIASFARPKPPDLLFEPVAGTEFGRRWAGADQSVPGGFGNVLTAVDIGEGRSAVLITECGD